MALPRMLKVAPKIAPVEEKGDWVAQIRCTVMKSVVLCGCTREEAQKRPWDYAEDEHEMHQEDWEVVSLEPNE